MAYMSKKTGKKGANMLLSFSVSNFGSFNEKAIFSMFPGKISKQHENHVLGCTQYKALKGAALYGANASGKSNFVKAIAALQSIVAGKSSQNILLNQFKLGNSSSETEFEIVFQYNKVTYQYVLRTNGVNIPFEQLAIVQRYGKLKPLFTRENENVNICAVLSKSIDWYKNRTFQSTNAYLFKLWQDGIVSNREKISGAEHIINAIDFFSKLLIIKSHSFANPSAFSHFFKRADFQVFLKKLLHIADLGITNIDWSPLSKEDAEKHLRLVLARSTLPNGYGTILSKNDLGEILALEVGPTGFKGRALKTIHDGVEFKLSEESAGTVRLIDLSLSFFLLKDPDLCLIIDELDCHLHPLLSRFLLQNHMENADNKGQLIVTLHDLNLMTQDIWRTDEIWFAEKRQDGSTDLYSLYQFSPRIGENLQKGYMQGKYGAIPMIGSFDYE